MNVSIIILVYNHERYIQECLESIKHQVIKYNKDRQHWLQVIIGDDASADKTEEKVNQWLAVNKNCFSDFIYLRNEQNAGTCKNYLNALERASGDYIKAIGGDDFFPERSIFELMSYLDKYDIVYGNPLVYVEGKNNSYKKVKKEVLKIHCNYMEESRLSYYDRIHRYCFFNAPGTYVKKELLTNREVRDFLSEYKYIDDYTQWIKYSELRDIHIKYIPGITVIYRRTSGSAYFVRNKEVRREIIQIYQYALQTSREWFGKLLVRNAIYMQKKENPVKYLDIMAYLHKFYQIKHRNGKGLEIGQEIAENLAYIKKLKRNAARLQKKRKQQIAE